MTLGIIVIHKNLGIVVCGSLLRDRMFISWLVIINSFHLHNFFSFLFFLVITLLHYMTSIVIVIIIILFLLLNYSYLHHNFSHFYPSCLGVRKVKGTGIQKLFTTPLDLTSPIPPMRRNKYE